MAVHKKTLFSTTIAALIAAPSTLALSTGFSPLDTSVELIGGLFNITALQNETVALGFAKFIWFIILFAVLNWAGMKAFSGGDNQHLNKRTANIISFSIAALAAFFTPANVILTATSGYTAFLWSLIILLPAIIALILAFGTEKARDKDASAAQRFIELIFLGAGFLWTIFMLGTLVEWITGQFPETADIVQAATEYMMLIMLIAVIVKIFQAFNATQGGNAAGKLWDSWNKKKNKSGEETPGSTTSQESSKNSDKEKADFSVRIGNLEPFQPDPSVETKMTYEVNGSNNHYKACVYGFGDREQVKRALTQEKIDPVYKRSRTKKARAGNNEIIFRTNYEQLKGRYVMLLVWAGKQARYDIIFLDQQGKIHRSKKEQKQPEQEQPPRKQPEQKQPEKKQEPQTPKKEQQPVDGNWESGPQSAGKAKDMRPQMTYQGAPSTLTPNNPPQDSQPQEEPVQLDRTVSNFLKELKAYYDALGPYEKEQEGETSEIWEHKKEDKIHKRLRELVRSDEVKQSLEQAIRVDEARPGGAKSPGLKENMSWFFSDGSSNNETARNVSKNTLRHQLKRIINIITKEQHTITNIQGPAQKDHPNVRRNDNV